MRPALFSDRLRTARFVKDNAAFGVKGRRRHSGSGKADPRALPVRKNGVIEPALAWCRRTASAIFSRQNRN